MRGRRTQQQQCCLLLVGYNDLSIARRECCAAAARRGGDAARPRYSRYPIMVKPETTNYLHNDLTVVFPNESVFIFVARYNLYIDFKIK